MAEWGSDEGQALLTSLTFAYKHDGQEQQQQQEGGGEFRPLSMLVVADFNTHEGLQVCIYKCIYMCVFICTCTCLWVCVCMGANV